MSKLAKFVIALMSVECFLVSLGFLWTGNLKLAAYWFFIGGVNTVAYTF